MSYLVGLVRTNFHFFWWPLVVNLWLTPRGHLEDISMIFCIAEELRSKNVLRGINMYICTPSILTLPSNVVMEIMRKAENLCLLF